jgi:hypothetical protein
MIQNLLDSHLNPDAFGIRENCLKKLRASQLERLDLLVQQHPILLKGEFFLRSTSKNGIDFTYPEPDRHDPEDVVAWSRMTDGQEVLCAINLAGQDHAQVYVTVDHALHPINSAMQCLYASELSPAELNVEVRNGKSIRLTIPPHGLVIYS